MHFLSTCFWFYHHTCISHARHHFSSASSACGWTGPSSTSADLPHMQKQSPTATPLRGRSAVLLDTRIGDGRAVAWRGVFGFKCLIALFCALFLCIASVVGFSDFHYFIAQFYVVFWPRLIRFSLIKSFEAVPVLVLARCTLVQYG